MTEQQVIDAELAAKVATEQAAASAVAETETKPDPSADGKLPEKGGVQKRIDELTKARRLAEAEVEFWKSKAIGKNGTEQPVVETPKAKPKPADFDTTESYLDARDAWVKDETMRNVEETFKKHEQASEQRSEAEILAAEWTDAEDSTKEKHADYEAMTANAMDALKSSEGPAKAVIAKAVQDSENGPEILYYLGQHPEEVESIAALSPKRAYFAVAGIAARLATETSGGETKPPETRAPKPPTPIRRVAPAEDGELRDDLSPETWKKRFLKKMENR